MIWIILLLAVAFFAYSNGANDNFKGFATLYGAGMITYKKAITWATITTFMGSMASISLAVVLVRNFSGKGLIPDVFVNDPIFAISVALGAALTVLLATRMGFPVSSTHAMVGALVGTGYLVSSGDIRLGLLVGIFLLPLLISPLLSALLSGSLVSFQRFRSKPESNCICPENKQLLLTDGPRVYAMDSVALRVDTLANCQEDNLVSGVYIAEKSLIETLHFISAGLVSFARGLNDTPKIVALLLLVPWLSIQWGMVVVAVFMAVGGLIQSRKIAETMGKKISKMNNNQGFTSNLVTSVLVISASLFGLPVSTTHVSVGSIVGMGAANGTANFGIIRNIFSSWILTLPIGACMGILSYNLLVQFFL